MQACCEHPQKRDVIVCPGNGKVCKPVSRITVEALIRPEHKDSLTPTAYYFCDSPECDVVYVPACAQPVITKSGLRVRVGIKEKEDPIPLCYCFGIDKKAILEDLRSNGATQIPKIITQRIKTGECRCELTNPSGGCCLGDIYRVAKQAQETRKSHGR
jgi:hypothetical protein